MRIRWPWRRDQAVRRSRYSVSDPALASIFSLGTPNYSGVEVGEGSALGLSAVYRAVALISGTLASLPVRTMKALPDGQRERVASFLDTPGGPDGATPFEWTETILIHLLLHGNAFLLHVRNGAGALAALDPVHPLCVGVELAAVWPEDPTRRVVGGKLFRVTMQDGSIQVHDCSTLTHIVGMSTDGVRGLSPISVARNSLGTAVAGDRAAAKMFSDGALISGLVSADGDDIDDDEAKTLKESLERGVSGWENAASIRFVNRKLKFTPWTMSAEDAQFLQSRSFQVEEVARWFGVPPHLLMQTEKQTSWGTGVESQNRGLQRTVLAPWATRIEQRLSRLLRGDRFVEFDFTGLVRPTPEQEIDLLAQQVDKGLMTLNEARSVRNMPPVPGGDVLRIGGVPLAQLDAAGAPAPAPTGEPA